MKFLDYICENLPLPALEYAHSRFHVRFRLCAFFVVSLALSITAYQCAAQFNQWLDSPISISTLENFETSVTMPAMFVCPDNQLRLGNVSAYKLAPLELMVMQFSFDRKKYLTKSSLKYTFDNLSVIIDDLKNIRDNILTSSDSDQMVKRYNEVGDMFKPYFETIAKQLTTINPAAEGKIYLADENDTLTFDEFRDINDYYDDCLRAVTDREHKSKTPFAQALIYCRLVNNVDITKDYTLIGFLERLNTMDYHRFLYHALPKQEEIIKNCKWANKECNITHVQTSRGRCFRIAPMDINDAEIKELGDQNAVNFVLDLYSYGTKDINAMVYFRPHNQTEFSLAHGGVQVRSGRRTTMEISQIYEISRVDTNCGEYPLKHFSEYTKENCEWNHLIEEVRKNCSCLPHRYPLPAENHSMPFCSLAQTFGCADFQNQNVDDSVCPNDCNTVSYDIDISTMPIQYKEISDHLPENWRQRDACLSCDFNFFYDRNTTPGAPQFQYMMNEVFQMHKNMIRIFWWKSNDKPYLPAYLHNTSAYFFGPVFPSTTHYNEYIDGDYEIPCVHKYLRNTNLSEEDLNQILAVVNQLTMLVDNKTRRWYLPFQTYEKWLRKSTATISDYLLEMPATINFPLIARLYKPENSHLFAEFDDVLRNLSLQLEDLDIDLVGVIENMTLLFRSSDTLKTMKAKTIANTLLTCLTSLEADLVQLQHSTVFPGTSLTELLTRWAVQLQDFIEHYLKMYSDGRGYDESNLAQVEIYYRSFRRHVTTEEHSYTIWSLLSDIGGALGLWIGATVITVFEVIVVLLNPDRFLDSKKANRIHISNKD